MSPSRSSPRGTGRAAGSGTPYSGCCSSSRGAYAFASLQESALFLALFVTVMIGVLWIVEGFTALFTLGDTGSTAMTILFAIISVLAGFALLSTPVWGAGFLWWLFAVSLLVLGVLNVVRAFPLRGEAFPD